MIVVDSPEELTAEPSSSWLPLSRGVHSPDHLDSRGIERVAYPKQRVEGRRLQVPLELADVEVRQTSSK
jgi:hypothetical protein